MSWNWHLETVSANAHSLEFNKVKAGETRRIFLMSDEHVDNQKCDRKMLSRHHAEAIECDAPIFKFGDTFCAMQGKWDKRADQNQLRPEHRGNNYLDRLVDTTADYYTPYSKQIALVTPGNHETSIEDRHQTSLLDRWAEQLKSKTGTKPAKGSYSGFLRIDFGPANGALVLNWHHGYGGGGEVTRGLIDNSRTRGQAEADIYYSGHVHRRNLDENVTLYLTERMRVKERRQWFIRGSTYKDEHVGGNGWHVAQGRAAKPKGGWWLEFKVHGREREILVTPIPAL